MAIFVTETCPGFRDDFGFVSSRKKLKHMRYKITLIIAICIFISMSIPAQTIDEAEEADDIYQGVIESEYKGFTGIGYVNYNNQAGSYIEWYISKADTGICNLAFCYAKGSTTDRQMKIVVNGVEIDTAMSFPGTGAWTTWVVDSIHIPLKSGLYIIS